MFESLKKAFTDSPEHCSNLAPSLVHFDGKFMDKDQCIEYMADLIKKIYRISGYTLPEDSVINPPVTIEFCSDMVGRLNDLVRSYHKKDQLIYTLRDALIAIQNEISTDWFICDWDSSQIKENVINFLKSQKEKQQMTTENKFSIEDVEALQREIDSGKADVRYYQERYLNVREKLDKAQEVLKSIPKDALLKATSVASIQLLLKEIGVVE